MREKSTFLSWAWQNTPNAISLARLGATVVLLAAVVTHRLELFKWLLLACLLSDIADGLIARAFKLTSKLGASLDSAADLCTMLLAFIGILVFQRPFLADHWPAFMLVMALYAVEFLAALVRYGKPSSFHTLLDRVAAYLGGAFIVVLFFWGYQGWLFYPTIGVYVISLLEEGILLYLLPDWRADVGGLHRVLARRECAS